MFNFNINFNRIIKDNLPWFLRWPLRLAMLRVMSKPFRQMHQEFIAKKNELFYKAQFNGQIIYLETALNDRFDPTNRAIFISQFEYDKVYIYKKAELKPAIVLYRRWKSAQAYNTGQFVWYNGLVYEANVGNTNKTPGVDPEWTLTTRKAPVIRKAINFNGVVSFVVNVPSALVFNQDEMRALINYYKLAGRGYIIVTF